MTPEKFLKFLKDENGAVAVEYVVLVAGVGLVLAAGVYGLFGAMRNLFVNTWAGYFGPT